jgi:hypothetical protein
MNALKATADTPTTPTAATHAGEQHRSIPRPCTLDAASAELSANDGVSLLDLEPLTTLLVRTSHSVYRMIVLQGTTVLLQGGAFPDATTGQLQGSGFGGHLLKLGWIGVGLRMEISVDGKRIITSTVRAITIGADPSTHSSQ